MSHQLRSMKPGMLAWCFPFIVLVVMACQHFLDTRLALGVMGLIKSSDTLRIITSDIPDALFLLVCIGSGFFWGYYFYLRHKGIINDNLRFSQLAGSAVPLAYILKGIFKYVFGRTNTRVWLANQASDDFHWFHGGGDYSGFPSGHMTVFSAFLAAIWVIYPRYRSISCSLVLLLGVALIVTDYHFLSDVIAGTYLGLIATCLTKVYLDNVRR